VIEFIYRRSRVSGVLWSRKTENACETAEWKEKKKTFLNLMLPAAAMRQKALSNIGRGIGYQLPAGCCRQLLKALDKCVTREKLFGLR